MQIRPNAAFLQAISRASEPRPAALAEASQPASGVAAPQSPLSSQRPGHAQEPMRPRGSVLNILV